MHTVLTMAGGVARGWMMAGRGCAVWMMAGRCCAVWMMAGRIAPDNPAIRRSHGVDDGGEGCGLSSRMFGGWDKCDSDSSRGEFNLAGLFDQRL